MKKLLKELSVIPGVAGSCIFDKQKGPLCNDLQHGLSEDLLQTVGIHLVRMIQMGAMGSLAIKTVTFRFDKYSVVGMPLRAGSVLLTICESLANCSLVAATASMLAADMLTELESGASSRSEKSPSAGEGDVVPQKKVDTALQARYEAIEKALAGAIGPVAGMVMQDCIDNWKKSGDVIVSRLPELMFMLTEEIGDPVLIKEFTSRVEGSD